MAYGPVSDSVVRARCEGAPIRKVEIHSLDIFDPVPASRFAAVYALANKLHVHTRASTIRSQLLIAPGQPWSADRISESQRLLRELEYIEPDFVRSRLAGDSVDVLVVTHDQWTTQPELNLERGGGRTYGSVGFTERNLLGLGLGVSLAFREEPTGRTRTADVSGRRLFGTQLEAQFQAGTGSGGISNGVYLRDPFRSLLIAKSKAERKGALPEGIPGLLIEEIERRCRELKVPSLIAHMGATVSAQTFIDQHVKQTELAIINNRWWPAKYSEVSEPMMAAYKKKTGTDPTNFAVQAHDATLVLLDAIQKAGSLDPQKIQAALESTTFVTAWGTRKFTPLAEGHRMPIQTVVVQIQGGRREIVWPEALATAKWQLPYPAWAGRKLLR